MEITDSNLKQFRKDFAASVKSLEEKYGVTLSLGNITYSPEQFTTKLTVTNGRDIFSREENAFDANVWKYQHLGLKKGMYNQIFIGKDGKKYALRGLNTRAPRYPLLITRLEDGEHRKAGERFIREILNEKYVPNLADTGLGDYTDE